MTENKIIVGDCLEKLKELPDGPVNCIVTSPPYFGLRSYLPDGHPDKSKEVGLEGDLQSYIDNLVTIFRESRRVLRDDGTLWLNLGDSYARSPSEGRRFAGGNELGTAERLGKTTSGNDIPVGLKPKDLIGVPWRVALALQADGWYLRDAIVWAKGTSGEKRQGSVMPSSVKDRFCSAYEMVFLFSKSPRYYFDMDSVKEESLSSPEDISRAWESAKKNHQYRSIGGQKIRETSGGTPTNRATPRNVWLIGTKPFKEAHFATFPPALAEMCVKAGCAEGGVVLDPFFGAGTVGVVAKNLGRHYIGIELNADYAKMAHKRIEQS